MPLNDDLLLPRRARTMEQLADTLQTEQSELDLMQRTLVHQVAQLTVCTADDELARYERTYGIPVNPSLSIADRRTRIIAKANSRDQATLEFLRRTVENLTGLKVTIKEIYSAYTLRFTVFLNAKYELNVPLIKSQIKELRPAHLAFEVLPVAQIDVVIPASVGIVTGVHKQYLIQVQWSAKRAQSVDIRQQCGIPMQSHMNYYIEVK